MGYRTITISAICFWQNVKTIELAVMLFPFQSCKHIVYEIIDVEKFQFNAWVIDDIGQVVGKSVAEGGNCAVIVWPTPFAEEIRETID